MPGVVWLAHAMRADPKMLVSSLFTLSFSLKALLDSM
jgi:hypothetical protein